VLALQGNQGDVVTVKADQFEPILKQVGAWQTGHFLLASGLHSNEYLQCQKLLQYPRHGLIFAEALVQTVLAAGHKPTAVVGPALGAVHWELLVALALDRASLKDEPIRGIFAERPEGKFEIRRGTNLSAGESVLVVEDVTTTGGSARDVVELVRQLGANPIAVGAIVDRSGGKAMFDVPFYSLVPVNMATYEPDSCPMCKAGEPLYKPGSTNKT
jgi:orotate phosphoribosyltransferase